jgi:PAS domain S-box-containing protein
MPTKKLRLLLIDDSPEDRVYIKRLLTIANKATTMTFLEAGSLKEGLQALHNSQFDCVILDQSLPDGAGLDLIHSLRGSGSRVSVPVVFMTGFGDENLAAQAIKAGALEYVPKRELTQHLISRAVLGSIKQFQLAEQALQAEERAKQELNESLRQYRSLVDSVPQIVFTCTADGSREYLNAHASSYTGIRPEEMNLSKWESIIHPDDLDVSLAHWAQALANGQLYEAEYRIRRKSDGMYRWHLSRAVPCRNGAGSIIRWVVTCTDIHYQKAENDRLEVLVAFRTEQLRRSLDEKQLLLDELHHRVKNNLQVIVSLINLQTESLQGPEAIALKDCLLRIETIASVYQRLQFSDRVQEVDFADYAEAILDGIIFSRVGGSSDLEGHVEASPIVLNLDQAIPCGLILNELITNVMKYAYPGGKGLVQLRIENAAPGWVRFSVSDQGIGFSPDSRIKDRQPLGLLIVEGLVNQLNGTLTTSSDLGVTTVVEFPLHGKRAKSAGAA